jgi:hypothetical protein
MGGKASRVKGHSFERLIARLWRGAFPGSEAARGLQYRDPSFADVEGTPFRIECKRQEKVSYNDIVKALEKAEDSAKKYNDDRPVVVVTKEDRGDILSHMRLSTLFYIVENYFDRIGKK